jgi:CheY-like chemotaxis protein
MMPVMNGFEFLAWFKANEGRLGRVPVVVFSANAKEYGRTLAAYGPLGVLEKPVALDKLLGFLHAHWTSTGQTW